MSTQNIDVLVWLNNRVPGSQYARYELVAQVFRPGLGFTARGEDRPELFFPPQLLFNPLGPPYDLVVRLTPIAFPELAPLLALRIARLFEDFPWIRVLFQVAAPAGFPGRSLPAEGPPAAIPAIVQGLIGLPFI